MFSSDEYISNVHLFIFYLVTLKTLFQTNCTRSYCGRHRVKINTMYIIVRKRALFIYFITYKFVSFCFDYCNYVLFCIEYAPTYYKRQETILQKKNYLLKTSATKYYNDWILKEENGFSPCFEKR